MFSRSIYLFRPYVAYRINNDPPNQQLQRLCAIFFPEGMILLRWTYVKRLQMHFSCFCNLLVLNWWACLLRPLRFGRIYFGGIGGVIFHPVTIKVCMHGTIRCYTDSFTFFTQFFFSTPHRILWYYPLFRLEYGSLNPPTFLASLRFSFSRSHYAPLLPKQYPPGSFQIDPPGIYFVYTCASFRVVGLHFDSFSELEQPCMEFKAFESFQELIGHVEDQVLAVVFPLHVGLRLEFLLCLYLSDKLHTYLFPALSNKCFFFYRKIFAILSP
mmetsp:Transcript_7859/g.14599  ORF Transcript_7859/g.14599 Transcript_7859/m.14599 type:complete len:270 (+) Transcript_7859:20-829(+)